MVISKYIAVKCVPSAHCFVKECSETLRLVRKVSAWLLRQCHCTPAQLSSDRFPAASLLASRLSAAVSPPALLLLECPHGASCLPLWVRLNWGLSEKKSRHDAGLRKSARPLYLLCPRGVPPKRQEGQGRCMWLLPAVPPQGSEKQLFQDALLIAQA